MSIKYTFVLAFALSFHLLACTQPVTNQQKPAPAVSVPPLAKDQKMDTAFFWKIMDYGFAKGQFNNETKRQALLEQLVKLTPAQLQDFEIIWRKFSAAQLVSGSSTGLQPASPQLAPV